MNEQAQRMVSTREAVAAYLTIWPENRLTELREHCVKGWFRFISCSCLIGAFNAPHPLGYQCDDTTHLKVARRNPLAATAESWVGTLDNDQQRSSLIIEMIDHELERRRGIPAEFLSWTPSAVAELVGVK